MEALVVALGGLIGAVAVAIKVLTEVRGMRIEQDTQARRLSDVHAQTVNDHTSNFRGDLDAVRDLIVAQGETLERLDDGQTRLEAGQLRHDAEIGHVRRAQITASESIGQVGERLAAADMEDRQAAREEHKRIWDAIRHITTTKED